MGYRYKLYATLRGKLLKKKEEIGPVVNEESFVSIEWKHLLDFYFDYLFINTIAVILNTS